MKYLFFLTMTLFAAPGFAGNHPTHEDVARRLLSAGMKDGEAYSLLKELTTEAPHRLSGSKGAEIAVQVTARQMAQRGFANVHTESVVVPRWVRGLVERAQVMTSGDAPPLDLSVCALGRSIGTAKGGIIAGVVEVHSFEELKALGEKAKGKIIFYNRPMDPELPNTFAAYVGAVDQRSRGAIEAAKAGGVAAIVRSMTLALDDVPHTGAMGYQDSVPEVPAAAISTIGANTVSHILAEDPESQVTLELSCETMPDVESANVVGELRGSERPNEIIVVGGHLDAWDKGSGAHDDGSGCVQAIEVLNLLKKAGITPKRTIRAVMFMNEENGTRGAKAYPVAPERKGEVHIAAIESDRGGFAPRGISVQGDSTVVERVKTWQPLFELLNAGRIEEGYGGVDIQPLASQGVPAFGLDPENHRYFDYHHSDNDTIDKVNPRELQMGAIVEALLCYLISEDGL